MNENGATQFDGMTGKPGISSSSGQRAHRTNPEAGGLTVLVADDDAGIRKLVAHVLRSCGHIVLEAADGVAALEVAKQHSGPIHLLVTDWCMPRLNGGELIRRLKDGRPDTAILVMSGYIDSKPPPEVTLLPKPFNSQDLVNSVNGVIHGQASL